MQIEKLNTNIPINSVKQFCESIEPMQLHLRMRNIKKIQDCFIHNLPSLAYLKKTAGEEFVFLFISKYLIYLNEVVSVKRGLTEMQVELCALHILEKFSNFNFGDLQLITNRLIDGEVELYQTFDVPTVIKLFGLHAEQRAEFAFSNEKYQRLSNFDKTLPLNKKIELTALCATNNYIASNSETKRIGIGDVGSLLKTIIKKPD